MKQVVEGDLEQPFERQFKKVHGFLKDDPYTLPIDPRDLHWSMARCKGCYYNECDNTYHIIARELAVLVEGVARAVEPVFLHLPRHPESVAVLARGMSVLETLPWQYAAGVLSSEEGQNTLLDHYVDGVEPLVESIVALLVKLAVREDLDLANDLDRMHKAMHRVSKLSCIWAVKPETELGPGQWVQAYHKWAAIWSAEELKGGWIWPPQEES